MKNISFTDKIFEICFLQTAKVSKIICIMHLYVNDKLDKFLTSKITRIKQQLKFNGLTTLPKVVILFSKFIYPTNVKNKLYGWSLVSFPSFITRMSP